MTDTENQAVGGEWKLVPVEPTEEMIDASPEEGVDWNKDSRGYAANYYRAMIAAAPSPPAPSSAKVIDGEPRPPEFWERGFDKLIAIQKSDAALIETLKEALRATRAWYPTRAPFPDSLMTKIDAALADGGKG